MKDKLICIWSDWNPPLSPEVTPIEGEIYTFQGHDNHFWMRGFIHLKEIQGKGDGGNQVSFRADRFRPVDYSVGEETCERIESLIPETQNA